MGKADAPDISTDISAPDRPARAGIFLGAMAIGSSFQPNLLTRGTRDQAIISGLSAAVGFGFASASTSLLASATRRIPGTDVAGEATLAALGAAVAKALPY